MKDAVHKMKAQSKAVDAEDMFQAMDKVEFHLGKDGFSHEVETELNYILHNISKVVQQVQNKITELS